MGAVFLHGPLCDPALLRIVLGPRADALRRCGAILPDHAMTWAEGQVSPILTARPGAGAAGILLEDPDPQEVLRLDFYEGGFEHEPREVEISVAGALRAARAYFPRPGHGQPGAPFDLAEWQAAYGALGRIAAQEAMGYLGRFSARDLAARMPMIRARAAARLAATGVPAAWRSDTGANAVECISAEVLHCGFHLSEAHALRHPAFGGGMSGVLRREVFVATDAALVLPYDPVRDRVLMLEQFRIGPYRRGDPRPWILEPVAGRVDPGETPEDAARRECREEAGLTLRRLEKIASYYCTPGYSTEYFHNFVGIADLPDDLPRNGGLDTEAEDIRLHLIDFDDAMRLIGTGEADDGPLILSLLWLARERGRLRAAA